MTLDKLRAALAKLTHALDGRVEIWAVLIDVDGRVVKRIYRGYFIDRNYQPPQRKGPV